MREVRRTSSSNASRLPSRARRTRPSSMSIGLLVCRGKRKFDARVTRDVEIYENFLIGRENGLSPFSPPLQISCRVFERFPHYPGGGGGYETQQARRDRMARVCPRNSS